MTRFESLKKLPEQRKSTSRTKKTIQPQTQSLEYSFLHLQRSIGNREVLRLLGSARYSAIHPEPAGKSKIRRIPETPAPDPIAESIRILTSSPRLTNPTSALDRQLAGAVSLLTADMIGGVFAEEQERTGIARSIGETLRVGTSTYGRGAMGQTAVTDVDTNFPDEIATFAGIFGAAPTNWIDRVEDRNWAVFYTAAYMFQHIAQRENPVRDQDTQRRLGIALYHGGRRTVAQAQTAAARRLGKTTDALTWSEIEQDLRTLPEGPDIIDYVDGVVSHRFPTFTHDFTFNVHAQLVGRTRFVVGEYGTVRVSAEANYASDISHIEPERRPPPNYWIRIGNNRQLFDIGTRQEYTWTGLAPGSYVLHIYNRYINGTIPLVGHGRIEVRT